MNRVSRSFALCLLVLVPAAAQVVRMRATGSDAVFLTRVSGKYHQDGCRYLKSKIQVTREQAEKQGKSACKVCKP